MSSFVRAQRERSGHIRIPDSDVRVKFGFVKLESSTDPRSPGDEDGGRVVLERGAAGVSGDGIEERGDDVRCCAGSRERAAHAVEIELGDLSSAIGSLD